jgi:hypothetical protein
MSGSEIVWIIIKRLDNYYVVYHTIIYVPFAYIAFSERFWYVFSCRHLANPFHLTFTNNVKQVSFADHIVSLTLGWMDDRDRFYFIMLTILE